MVAKCQSIYMLGLKIYSKIKREWNIIHYRVSFPIQIFNFCYSGFDSTLSILPVPRSRAAGRCRGVVSPVQCQCPARCTVHGAHVVCTVYSAR